jgi:organic radical activating enzyme
VGPRAPQRDLNLVEIFWSVQGEGVRVGEPCAFVRFGECDLRCAWCDSVDTWLPAKRCRVEREPGSGRFDERENPTPVAVAAEAVARLLAGQGGLVSLTGGEPLLQAGGVRALASAIRDEAGPGVRILLETHGLAADALAEVIDQVDVVSMDWKLASDVRRASDPRHGPVRDFHGAHERFLEIASQHPSRREGASVYVKVVLTPASRDEELDSVCRAIERIDASTPLVLQPVTPSGPVRAAPTAAELLRWLRRCRETLRDVRVIPQTHKAIGAL